jgi:hypothetical protein
MLAECLRKVWTVIPLRKIQRAWEDMDILAEEQHGFRIAANIKRALEGELYFYSQIFGFSLADEVEPLEIMNLNSV